MVDPKIVINPLQEKSKEKNISSRGEISNNMTKLGSHVRISGNGNVFNRQKVWNNGDKSGHKKKETFKDQGPHGMVLDGCLDVGPTRRTYRADHA